MYTQNQTIKDIEHVAFLFRCAKQKIIQGDANGPYGLRKMFEWVMKAVFEDGYGDYPSTWEAVEDKVNKKGNDGWIEFWKDMEKKHPGISLEINKLNPNESPLSDFLAAYRKNVGYGGIQSDIDFVKGKPPVQVSELAVKGLTQIIDALERQLQINQNKGCLTAFLL